MAKTTKVKIQSSKLFRTIFNVPEEVDCEIIKENKSTVVIYVPLMDLNLTVKRNKLIYG